MSNMTCATCGKDNTWQPCQECEGTGVEAVHLCPTCKGEGGKWVCDCDKTGGKDGR